MRRVLSLTIVGTLLVPALLACLPGGGVVLARNLLPYAPWDRPSVTALTVWPSADLSVSWGADLRIEAQARPTPGKLELVLAWDDGVSERLPMTLGSDGAHVRTLSAVTRDLSFTVRAGDAVSVPVRVRVTAPPQLSSLRLEVRPPAYTGLAPQLVTGGEAEVLSGSEVTVQALLSGSPLRSAVLVVDDRTEMPMHLAPGLASAVLRPTTTTRFRLRLYAADLSRTDPALTGCITVREDQPPRAVVRTDGLVGRLVPADAPVPIQVQAEDDVAIDRLDLEIRNEDGSSRRQALTRSAGDPPSRMQACLTLVPQEGGARTGEDWILVPVVKDVSGQERRGEAVRLRLTTAGETRFPRLLAAVEMLADTLRGGRSDLDLVREAWVEATRRFRADDPAAHRLAMILLRQRGEAALAPLASWPAAARSAAALSAGDLPARALIGLAARLEAWRTDLTGTSTERCDRALLASPETAPAILREGIRALVMARSGLDRLASRLDLIVLWARSRVLEVETGLAAGRLERLLPRLRGESGWRAFRGAPGLVAEFFTSTDLTGPVVHRQTVDPPLEWMNVPNAGRDRWSMIARGDLLIPSTGTWILRAVTDDGVQVEVDGRLVTSPEAWKRQAPTAFDAKLDLTGGWHALVVRFFQDGGQSRLRLHLGQDPAALAEIPPWRLAHLAGTAEDPPGLLDDMVRLAPIPADAAETLVREDSLALAGLPAAIGQWSGDPRLERIQTMAAAQANNAHELRRLIGMVLSEGWPIGLIDRLDATAAPLADLPAMARRILEASLAREEGAVPGPLSASLETVLDRLRRLAIPVNAEDEADTTCRQALAATSQKRLSVVAQEALRRIDAVAGRSGPGIRERCALQDLATVLDRDVIPLIESTTGPPTGERLAAIEHAVQSAIAAETAVQTAQEAALAEHALAALEHLRDERRRESQAGWGDSAREATTAIAALAKAWRERGIWSKADDLEALLALELDGDPKAAVDRLLVAATVPVASRIAPARPLSEVLAAAQTAFDREDESGRTAARADLERLIARMALAAGTRQLAGDTGGARVQERLAKELRAGLADDPIGLARILPSLTISQAVLDQECGAAALAGLVAAEPEEPEGPLARLDRLLMAIRNAEGATDGKLPTWLPASPKGNRSGTQDDEARIAAETALIAARSVHRSVLLRLASEERIWMQDLRRRVHGQEPATSACIEAIGRTVDNLVDRLERTTDDLTDGPIIEGLREAARQVARQAVMPLAAAFRAEGLARGTAETGASRLGHDLAQIGARQDRLLDGWLHSRQRLAQAQVRLARIQAAILATRPTTADTRTIAQALSGANRLQTEAESQQVQAETCLARAEILAAAHRRDERARSPRAQQARSMAAEARTAATNAQIQALEATEKALLQQESLIHTVGTTRHRALAVIEADRVRNLALRAQEAWRRLGDGQRTGAAGTLAQRAGELVARLADGWGSSTASGTGGTASTSGSETVAIAVPDATSGNLGLPAMILDRIRLLAGDPARRKTLIGYVAKLRAEAGIRSVLENPTEAGLNTDPLASHAVQAGWARPAARTTPLLRSDGIEHFSEEHQEAIRAYFQRLSETSGQETRP